MKKMITENGLNYVLDGEYYIPCLAIPEEERPIGRWGRMYVNYLKEHHPVRYHSLLLSGKLQTYLAELNEQTQLRLELIIQQMKKAECITESLKESDQMAWVRAMNSIRNQAEEIILHEMIIVEN